MGMAIEALKHGYKVARSGWNGKNMFLYLVGQGHYPAQTEAAKETFGELVPYTPYVAMKTANNEVTPWSASQSDLLANDWCIVD
jgi:hypothetical protein